LFTACGGSGGEEETSSPDVVVDSKYTIVYKGLSFYKQDLPASSYQLIPLLDDEFNGLSKKEQLQVADKLLTTLFFSYDPATLEAMIQKGDFLESLSNGIMTLRNNIAEVERAVLDEDKIYRPTYHKEVVDILSRFYVTKYLDRYYFNNWMAYILTQTIMFSPAYELDSTHNPNVASVYNRLVNMIEDESTMQYITYVHMSSEDNWRRFRSPEDNGREMLEIFTFDDNDKDVPIAATALQNWKLDRDSDTLVIGLNENTKPLRLFGTTIYNGDDFYRELVKSKGYQLGVVKRLVAFFFTDDTQQQQDAIVAKIIASHPQTFKDILAQIVFSKEYLLNTARPKSAEELFYSFAKKTDFQIEKYTIYDFKNALQDMNQASMKYKLGKLERVPLDTLSFINYDKYMREQMLMRRSNPQYKDDYTSWSRQGWSESFIARESYGFVAEDAKASLENLINYLFLAILQRDVTRDELDMFENFMMEDSDGVTSVRHLYDLLDERLTTDGVLRGDEHARYVTMIVFDYISRLEDIFVFKKVK